MGTLFGRWYLGAQTQTNDEYLKVSVLSRCLALVEHTLETGSRICISGNAQSGLLTNKTIIENPWTK